MIERIYKYNSNSRPDVSPKNRHQFFIGKDGYKFCVKCGWDKSTIKRCSIRPCVSPVKRLQDLSKEYRHDLVYNFNKPCECGYLYNYYWCKKCQCDFSCCKNCSIFDKCHVSWTKAKTIKEEVPIIVKNIGTDIEMEIPCRYSDNDIDVFDIIV